MRQPALHPKHRVRTAATNFRDRDYLASFLVSPVLRYYSTEDCPPKLREMILVVDDNAGNQYTARAVLERFGYRAQLVSNGEEALDAYSKDNFDLILMDCRMPIMDGYEATSAIRRAEDVT